MVLNADVPLPQPQSQLQPIQPAAPHRFDMYPRLSPATRPSLTPSGGFTARSSLWKQSQPGPNTRAQLSLSVTTLGSKVTVEARTPPLCQTVVSPGPWAGRAYHQSLVGLPVITLHKVWTYLSGNLGAVSEAHTFARGPFHPEVSVLAHTEMKSALPCCHYQLRRRYQRDICGGT